MITESKGVELYYRMSQKYVRNANRLTPQKSFDFIQKVIKIKNSSFTFELDSKKHAFIAYQNFEKIFELKLPLPFPKIRDDEKIENYLKRITNPFQPYTVILIQAGYCALGYFENGAVSHHIALRTYMTRKKQGKNELIYLNKGRKGRSEGSQLRYQNALRFFEEINEKLNEWNKITNPSRLLYSCPIKMWPYLFESKVKCCFDKKDYRLQKIPLDVGVPNFEELLRVNRYISFGYLTRFPERY